MLSRNMMVVCGSMSPWLDAGLVGSFDSLLRELRFAEGTFLGCLSPSSDRDDVSPACCPLSCAKMAAHESVRSLSILEPFGEDAFILSLLSAFVASSGCCPFSCAKMAAAESVLRSGLLLEVIPLASVYAESNPPGPTIETEVATKRNSRPKSAPSLEIVAMLREAGRRTS